MVVVKNITCELPGCKKRSAFNVLNSKTGRFCSEHKEEGMEDVTTTKCGHPSCINTSSFNVPGSKTRRFCSEHKKEGMINLRRNGR